jgi:hypothetical protein
MTHHRPIRRGVALAFAIATFAAAAGPALATPISATSLYNFRDNNYGLVPGPARDIIVFGAFTVSPDGPGGTTATYRQTDTLLGTDVSGVLPYQPYSGASPGVFETIVPWSPGLSGAWEFEFTNGADTTTVTTGVVGTPDPVPLAENVRVTRTGPQPTVTWDAPTFDVDWADVYIFEKLSPDTFDIVHFGFGTPVDPASGTWTAPAVLDSGGALEAGRLYAFAVAFSRGNDARLHQSRSLYAVEYRVAVPVPEPGTWGLMGVGVLLMIGVLRRTRR